MLPHRKKRLILILFLLAGVSIALALALVALQENLNFFYAPAAVVSGKAPVNSRIRLGGMVLEGSVLRQADRLGVSFRVGDLQGAEVQIVFQGILPDLFREGQGVIALGALDGQGVFHATEVLAKHDENYMPPELADALAKQKAAATERKPSKP